MRTKQDRIKEFIDFANQYSDISEYLADELDKIGFFTAPASTIYHGNYEGGLFDHSLEVAKQLINLTEKLGLTWIDENSPFIVGMFHDLCKCNDYVWDIETEAYIYNPENIFPDHGTESIIRAQQIIKLNDEEITCIRWHMGAYEKDTRMWKYYNRAIEKYPNVLYTHTADMIASHIIGV